MKAVTLCPDPALFLFPLACKRIERRGDLLPETRQLGVDDHEDNKSCKDNDDSVCHPIHGFSLI
jgi:hypothetical protein